MQQSSLNNSMNVKQSIKLKSTKKKYTDCKDLKKEKEKIMEYFEKSFKRNYK